MEIAGHGTETYLYINGISTPKEILLHDNIILAPVFVPFQYEKVSDLLKNEVDLAIATVSGRTIASQIRVFAADEEELVCTAWKTAWDCILLGAVFHCEVMGNIQCDKPVEQLPEATYINITNYAFRAMLSAPYGLTENDLKWIESYYPTAFKLLDKAPFMTAVHAMASYRWHVAPRVQLAILWSGIEALFNNENSDVSFRISLFIANFMAGENATEAKGLFVKVRKLYSSRSSAVHGSKIKGDMDELVSESAALLNRIIRRCAELGALPDTKNLVFQIK